MHCDINMYICVYMCVYMYVYMYVYMWVYVYICVYMCIDKVQNNCAFGFKHVYVTSEIHMPFKYF